MKLASAAKFLIPLTVLLLVGDAVAFVQVNKDDKQTVATKDAGESGEKGSSPAASPSVKAAASPTQAANTGGGAGGGGNTNTGGGGGGPAKPATGLPKPRGDGSALPGGYLYAFKNAGGGGGESQMFVTDVSRGGGEIRQTVRGAPFPGDPGIKTFVIRSGGITIPLITYFGEECNWKPSIQMYKYPLRQGATWSVDSKCTISGDGQDNEFRWTETASVRNEIQIDIDGSKVKTRVIHRKGSFSGKNAVTGASILNNTYDQQEAFSQAYAMILSVSGTYTCSGFGCGSPEPQQLAAKLRSLNPG